MKQKLSLIESIVNFSLEDKNSDYKDMLPLERKIEKIEAQRPVKHVKSSWTQFNLRIKDDMIFEIEQALEETIGVSKTGFILQSIQEKLRTVKITR